MVLSGLLIPVMSLLSHLVHNTCIRRVHFPLHPGWCLQNGQAWSRPSTPPTHPSPTPAVMSVISWLLPGTGLWFLPEAGPW